MKELQLLRADHEAAVLEFERANRAYFAASISDRGDDFFEMFAERHRALLAEQEAGLGAYHVLVDGDGTVVGRFNLWNLAEGRTDVGYRVAQRVAGRGVATLGLRELCRIARDDHGLRTLGAAASHENAASQRVLTKVGFVTVGPAEVGGRQGIRFTLSLRHL